MNCRPWTPEEEQVLRSNDGKLNAQQIGEQLGRSRASVFRRAYVLGISLRKTGDKHWRSKLTELQVQMISCLKDEGYTGEQIRLAFKLDVTADTINDAAAGRTWRG